VKDCQASIPRSWLVAAAHSDYSNGSSIDSNRTPSGNVLLDAPRTQGDNLRERQTEASMANGR
jgi:hypothetical protein